MLETRALVVQLDGKDAIVEALQGSGCGHCSSEGGCGSGKLSQMFCSQPRRFRVRNPISASVGDEVQVSVGEGVLLRGALILYGLPLCLLLGGGLMGAHYSTDPGSRDAVAAVGAGAGLLVGFLLAKLLSLSRLAVFSAVPSIIRREDAGACRSK